MERTTAATSWVKDFWSNRQSRREGLKVPPGLERLDSHSPLMLARLGNVKTQEAINKATEIFQMLANAKRDDAFGQAFAKPETASEARQTFLATLQRNLDAEVVLLGKLGEIRDVLEESGSEQSRTASAAASRSYVASLLAEEEEGGAASQSPSGELEALRTERDLLKGKVGQRDATLAQLSDQLRWAQWEIGASLN